MPWKSADLRRLAQEPARRAGAYSLPSCVMVFFDPEQIRRFSKGWLSDVPARY